MKGMYMELSLLKQDNVSLSEKAAKQIIKYIQENKMQKGELFKN